MKHRFVKTCSIFLALMILSGCQTSPQESANSGSKQQSLTFEAYAVADGSQSLPFTLTFEAPANWTAKSGEEEQWHNQLPPGDASCASVYFYEEGHEEAVAWLHVNTFIPNQYEGLTFPSENYYQGVFPALRLGSFCCWDPFTSLLTTDTGEVGTCEIYFMDNDYIAAHPEASMASVPQLESVGILAYDNSVKAYAALGFAADYDITADQLSAMAQTVAFEEK